jgi:hypothetical protein
LNPRTIETLKIKYDSYTAFSFLFWSPFLSVVKLANVMQAGRELTEMGQVNCSRTIDWVHTKFAKLAFAITVFEYSRCHYMLVWGP